MPNTQKRKKEKERSSQFLGKTARYFLGEEKGPLIILSEKKTGFK